MRFMVEDNGVRKRDSKGREQGRKDEETKGTKEVSLCKESKENVIRGATKRKQTSRA